MATDAGVTNFYKYASSIYFSGRCPFELLSERCRLDLQGKNFFLLASGATVWLGSVPREFFFAFGTIPIRFDKIEPVAVIVRFW